MTIKINITHNLYDLDKMMDELGNQDVFKAARAALNSSVRRTRVLMSKKLKSRINMRSTEIKKRIFFLKAIGSSLSSLEAALNISGTPISMINFIVGSKTPIKQKGIKVKRRRTLKARIKGSKKIRLQGAFIQDMQSKQVFRHKGKGRRTRALKTKSLAKIIFEEKIEQMIDEIFTKRFNRQFHQQIQWRWSKTANKYGRSPLRLPR